MRGKKVMEFKASVVGNDSSTVKQLKRKRRDDAPAIVTRHRDIQKRLDKTKIVRTPLIENSQKEIKDSVTSERVSKRTNKKQKIQKDLISRAKSRSSIVKLREEQSDVSEGDASKVENQTEAFIGFSSDDEPVSSTKDIKTHFSEKISKNNKDSALIHTSNRGNSPDKSEKPGIVYVGRIPHGFYEHEMRDYFSQFGCVLKLRLSRSRKTGASKHHAWIKFASATVAEIVTKTMDNYLMFGHLLKVKLVSDDQIPKNLFKGANRRFKVVPWNKIEGRKLKQPHSREKWQSRIKEESKRRNRKAISLRKIGYEFESPKIKSVDQILKK